MESNPFKFNSDLAWILSALVTLTAVIIGIVYTWYKRRQTEDDEGPEVNVQWPTGMLSCIYHLFFFYINTSSTFILLHYIFLYTREHDSISIATYFHQLWENTCRCVRENCTIL